MVVGCLGDVVFEVSAEMVRTLNNFQWSGSASYAAHKRHRGVALLEFTGQDADQISFDIHLSRALGIIPMNEIRKLLDYKRNGTPVSFVLGEHIYGRYRWVITDHQVQAESFDGRGNILSCRISLSLQEYLRE